MPTKTMKVNLCSLLVEMANTCQTIPTNMGTRVVIGCLERIAKRACELNDPALLKELETLCLVGEVG